MSHFDVFNGDADGLCALQQLRLAEPREAQLVTGVKRDIKLLTRVAAECGDSVTVLDIAMDNNRPALVALLARGVSVEYFDHHHAGEVPSHPRLQAHLDPAPDVCTSVLVDRYLAGRHRAWAVVGAYGDALPATARTLAAGLALGEGDLRRMRRLGECLNYNSYCDSNQDQMYAPEALFALMQAYSDPLEFIRAEPVYARLARQQARDMRRAVSTPALRREGKAAVFVLPDAPWARRAVGSFANRLKEELAGMAFAVLVPTSAGSLNVSLRVPAGATPPADAFARRHGGNGRATAAGINELDRGGVSRFANDFIDTYRHDRTC